MLATCRNWPFLVLVFSAIFSCKAEKFSGRYTGSQQPVNTVDLDADAVADETRTIRKPVQQGNSDSFDNSESNSGAGHTAVDTNEISQDSNVTKNDSKKKQDTELKGFAATDEPENLKAEARSIVRKIDEGDFLRTIFSPETTKKMLEYARKIVALKREKRMSPGQGEGVLESEESPPEYPEGYNPGSQIDAVKRESSPYENTKYSDEQEKYKELMDAM